MSPLNFRILALSTNFWPIKNDLSGNTVWPQGSGFQNLAKIKQFLLNFCQLKMQIQLASLVMMYETFSVIFKHCVKMVLY